MKDYQHAKRYGGQSADKGGEAGKIENGQKEFYHMHFGIRMRPLLSYQCGRRSCRKSRARVRQWCTGSTTMLPSTFIQGPHGEVSLRTAQISVEGDDVLQYRYKLDSGGFGPAVDAGPPIELVELAEGTHTLYVIGCDAAGNWQAEEDATVLSWEVQLAKEGDVNDDGLVDLADLVPALQTVSGQQTTAAATAAEDDDGDGISALEEALYVMQLISKGAALP